MILNYCNAIIIQMVDKSTRAKMKDNQNIGTGDNNIYYTSWMQCDMY